MKSFRAILSALLILCLVFPTVPASMAETSPETTAERGIHDPIRIDSDPADGYEGDYVVIYNPATSVDTVYSTGTMTGLIQTAVSANVVSVPGREQGTDAESWVIDVDAALNKGVEPYTPNPVRNPISYQAGDQREFQIYPSYSPTGSGTVLFKCLYVGEHCYIWTPVSDAENVYPLDGIDPSYAKAAADEFDSKFELMQSSFGDHYNGDSGDGRLFIMYYNIDEGWSGSGGYIGGFFWGGDMLNNDLPMLNIDTYPGVSKPDGSSSMKKTYSTMVHEYQHLINFSNTYGMHSWLNECFSAAAEEICYPGSSVIARILAWENDRVMDENRPAEYEYQADWALHNGYSMYDWSNEIPDVLALYAQVSFFAQYLFTRFGNTIYQKISEQFSDYTEVDAISAATGVNCSDLVREFRVAVTANAKQNQYGGIYGFKVQEGYDPSQYDDVQNPWDLLSPIIFTGESCDIKGGGAITVKPVNGVYNPPVDADPNLVYIGITLGEQPYVITAVSDNEEWGVIVSVDETTIVTEPKEGYYVSGYEVTEGAANAVVDGNIVRVSAYSDCTIKVFFEPIPPAAFGFYGEDVYALDVADYREGETLYRYDVKLKTLDETLTFTGAQVYLAYDAEMLSFVEAKTALEGATGINDKNGVLSFAWATDGEGEPMQTGDVVVSFYFQPNREILDGDVAEFRFTNGIHGVNSVSYLEDSGIVDAEDFDTMNGSMTFALSDVFTLAGADVLSGDITVREDGKLLYRYDIRAKDVPAAGLMITGAEIFLSFDHTILAVAKTEGMVDWTISENGDALLAGWASDTEMMLKEDDILLTLWFEKIGPVPDDGVVPIVFGVNALGNTSAVSIVFNGTVMDIEANTVDGSIRFEPILYGDANCDGVVTAADAAQILRAIVGLSTLSTRGVLNGDVDGDGEITAEDAALILRYIVGLISSFPAES